MSQSLLVYDDGMELFDAVAALLTGASAEVRAVPWSAAPVQAFLDAQFDERPFAFMLIEAETVHVGDAAVERLLEHSGFGGELAALGKRAYPPFAAPFGRLVHGREPDDLHGTFPLSDAARDHLEPLRTSYDVPVESE